MIFSLVQTGLFFWVDISDLQLTEELNPVLHPLAKVGSFSEASKSVAATKDQMQPYHSSSMVGT